jgi:hypothetical protein
LWDFFNVENKPSGGVIPSERERKRRNSLCAKPWVQGSCGKAARSSAADLCWVSRMLLHCWVLGFHAVRGTWKVIEGWVLFLFFFFFSWGWNQFSTLFFSLILWEFFFPWVEINSLHYSFLWFCGIFFLLCRKQTQWWWNPLRKIKKNKKLTLCETLSSRQLRKSCKVLYSRSLSSFWSALALLSF